jgi:flagellar biosynthesis/type III secretory pathway protein FliH
LSLSLISIALVVVTVFYADLLKKFNTLMTEYDKFKLHEDKKTMHILQEARKKAANDKNLEEMFREELESSILKQIDIFRREAAKAVSKMCKAVESSSEEQLKDFKEIMKQETYASQKKLEEKIEQDYASTQKELESYKQNEMKKVDESVYKIVYRVSELVLGKGLSLQEHQQIILEALDKAKEEGGLKR